MPAPLVSIEINQGATFNLAMVANTSDPSTTPPTVAPADLTGCTARMMIRKSYAAPTPLITLTTENGGLLLGGTAGTIDVTIAAAQTFLLSVATTNTVSANGPPSQLYVGDLDIIYSSGDIKRYANFLITVYATATK